MLYYNEYIDVVVPIGITIPFASTVFPDNFVECNGSHLLKTSYDSLFNIIGIMYGETDDIGAPTVGGDYFRVPDYQDQFIRGFDETGVADPDFNNRTDRGDGTSGAVVGSRQVDEFKSHLHSNYYTFATATASGVIESKIIRWKGSGSTYVNRGSNNQSGGTTETRPSNTSVVYAMRVI